VFYPERAWALRDSSFLNFRHIAKRCLLLSARHRAPACSALMRVISSWWPRHIDAVLGGLYVIWWSSTAQSGHRGTAHRAPPNRCREMTSPSIATLVS
jgi:hypothetical protein